MLRIPYIRAMMRYLGYSACFAVITGVWELPGAVALLVPRSPRLKEWALSE